MLVNLSVVITVVAEVVKYGPGGIIVGKPSLLSVIKIVLFLQCKREIVICAQKLNRSWLCIFPVFYNTPFKQLELKLCSVIILKMVFFGEITWGVSQVYYNVF